MKKIALTIAIVMMMGFGAFAQDYYDNGSMLGRSTFDLLREGSDDPTTPFIPYQHGLEGDVNGEETPLGSGIAVLLGLGGAYLIARRHKEEN